MPDDNHNEDHFDEEVVDYQEEYSLAEDGCFSIQVGEWED